MSRSRDKAMFILAALISLGFHAALIYAVINLTIGTAGGELFAATLDVANQSIEIERDPRDLYIEQQPLPEILDPQRRAQSAARKVLESASDLIRTTDPLQVTAPIQPAAPAKPTDPKATPELPPAAPLPPARPVGIPGGLDATQQLLALAQPAITPPTFTSPTDLPIVKLPDTAAPGGDFDPANIDALLRGPGVPGGTGKAFAPPPPPPPAPLPAPSIAKASPPAPLPLPLPDKVLVPRLRAQEKEAVHLDEDFDYRLITYVDPPRRGLFGDSSPPDDGYFEARLQPRQSLRRLKPLGKDVVYAIDTSESITGRWMDPIRRGVTMALDSLNKGDRFNIVMFKDQVSVLWPEGMLDATPSNIDRGRKFLSTAEASGYTDVNRALGRLLVRTVPPDRVYQIVLLSDGLPTRGAIDPRSIINLITRENDLVASIFCIGTGDRLNRELLQFLAYRNKGFVVYPQSPWKAAETIGSLAARLRYPIVKDATFAAIGVDGQQIFPRIPRDIYQTDPVSLFGRFAPDAQKLSMRLTGSGAAERLDVTFSLDFPHAQRGSEQVMNNWAFWKLHHLYSENIRQGDSKEIQRQIDQLKRRYKIKTSY